MRIEFAESGAAIWDESGSVQLDHADLDELYAALTRHRALGDDADVVRRVMAEVLKGVDVLAMQPGHRAQCVKRTRQRVHELGYETPSLRTCLDIYEELSAAENLCAEVSK